MESNFTIRPIVNCLPAWFRFAQCLRRYRDSKEAFPHLVNAGKYSTTFLVVIFATLRAYHQSAYPNTFDNPYTILWLLSQVLSSTYAYTWDIKMDWGLFDRNAGENKFLREEIVYSSTVCGKCTWLRLRISIQSLLPFWRRHSTILRSSKIFCCALHGVPVSF